MEYFMKQRQLSRILNFLKKNNQVEKSTNFFVNLFMKINKKNWTDDD